MELGTLAKKQHNYQSSKELIPIHDTNPFQPVLLMDPSPWPLVHLHIAVSLSAGSKVWLNNALQFGTWKLTCIPFSVDQGHTEIRWHQRQDFSLVVLEPPCVSFLSCVNETFPCLLSCSDRYEAQLFWVFQYVCLQQAPCHPALVTVLPHYVVRWTRLLL